MSSKKDSFSQKLTVRVDREMRKLLKEKGKREGLEEAVYARKLLYTHPELQRAHRK